MTRLSFNFVLVHIEVIPRVWSRARVYNGRWVYKCYKIAMCVVIDEV